MVSGVFIFINDAEHVRMQNMMKILSTVYELYPVDV